MESATINSEKGLEEESRGCCGGGVSSAYQKEERLEKNKGGRGNTKAKPSSNGGGNEQWLKNGFKGELVAGARKQLGGFHLIVSLGGGIQKGGL